MAPILLASDYFPPAMLAASVLGSASELKLILIISRD